MTRQARSGLPAISAEKDVSVVAEVNRPVTFAALALLGYVKDHFIGRTPVRSGLQTMLIGGVAAAATFAVAIAQGFDPRADTLGRILGLAAWRVGSWR